LEHVYFFEQDKCSKEHIADPMPSVTRDICIQIHLDNPEACILFELHVDEFLHHLTILFTTTTCGWNIS